MPHKPRSVAELSREELIGFLLETFHRTLVHYGLWFHETLWQTDTATAVELEDQVFRSSFAIQMRRLAKILGFAVDERGVPQHLKELSREQLLELVTGQAVNWLANDGVWFQAIESALGMDSAKRINDTCWTHYSPYEAERIKRYLGLGERSGLEGLKQALAFRNYALVNRQSIHQIDENSFVFQMNDCRVQSARKRRGLPDYPCRSVGLVEYPYFARSIDPRIQTECLGCPPDHHPEEWYCAWKFTLVE
jgi:hypothetical protein